MNEKEGDVCSITRWIMIGFYKNVMHKKIALLVVLTMISQILLSEPVFATTLDKVNREYKNDLIDEKIPEEVTEYVNECYEDIVETTCMYDESFDVESPNNCELGEPFVIYDLDGDMEAIYYYPVIEDKDVVLIISAINTTEGYALSASEELVSLLNKVEYVENHDLLFYESDCNIDVKNTLNEFGVSYKRDREKDRKMQSFEEKSYRECVDEISEKITEMSIVDLDERREKSDKEEILEKYTPSFSVDNVTGLKGGRTCKLYNAQGQGAYGNCWAASVATIVNYLKGTNYTAIQVCDKMGIGYDDGANIEKKQEALEKYGYTYKIATNQLGFGDIRANIDSKYPIAMSCFATKGGHATTLYGYNVTSSGSYIVMHNPGTATSVTLLYKNGGTTFTYNNKTWTWEKSLSYK